MTSSILKVPLSVRQEAWKFQHGEVCMGLVLSLCDRVRPLCDGRQPEDIPTLYGQILSLYAIYGRPFKQRNPLKLTDAVVPDSVRSTHDAAIKLRDKIFAHIDTNESAVRDDTGDLLGKMVIIRTGESFLCSMSSIMPRTGGIDGLKSLALEVRMNCQNELQRVWKQFSGAVESFPEGLYEINIEDSGDAPMLKAMPWNAPPDRHKPE
jgi:hypothetical protein